MSNLTEWELRELQSIVDLHARGRSSGVVRGWFLSLDKKDNPDDSHTHTFSAEPWPFGRESGSGDDFYSLGRLASALHVPVVLMVVAGKDYLSGRAPKIEVQWRCVRRNREVN